MHMNYIIMRLKIIKITEREFKRERRINIYNYMILWNKSYRSQSNKNSF